MAAVNEFTIAVRFGGARCTVKVLQYATTNEMHRAHKRGTGESLGWKADASCRSNPGTSNPVCTIRLSTPAVRHKPQIAVHELVHAAMAIYRHFKLAPAGALLWPENALDHFTPDNEDFAHLVSSLYAGYLEGSTE